MWRVHGWSSRVSALSGLTALAVSIPAAAGCSSGAADPPPYRPPPTGTTGSPSAPPATPTGVELRYGFDAGLSGEIYDEARRLPLGVRTERDGALRAVPHGSGYAVRFPERCTLTGPEAQRCPRAILESRSADFLNPATRPIQFGASVRITPDQLAAGANVLQKGFSTAGGQFKLQVDHGRASCVVTDMRDPKIYVARSSLSVVDGRWHALACERRGDRLIITVDGAGRNEVAVPAQLSISNDEPLRIGGKNTGPTNDQFAGEIDDVYVVIE